MNIKTIAGWLAVAVVMWWVIVDRNAAAHDVHNIGTWLSDAASGITQFFSSI